ncbi:hypothetical protein PMIN03_007622, partial [Paraphaeosphaeria minitans]
GSTQPISSTLLNHWVYSLITPHNLERITGHREWNWCRYTYRRVIRELVPTVIRTLIVVSSL